LIFKDFKAVDVLWMEGAKLMHPSLEQRAFKSKSWMQGKLGRNKKSWNLTLH
jgi:hypothetical protein